MQLNEKTVNPHGERIVPQDFQLLKVLGKGGYGKVVSTIRNKVSFLFQRTFSSSFFRFFKWKNFAEVARAKFLRWKFLKKRRSSLKEENFRVFFSIVSIGIFFQNRSKCERYSAHQSRKKYSRMRQSCFLFPFSSTKPENFRFSVSVHRRFNFCFSNRWQIIFDLGIFVWGRIVYATGTWRHFSR